MEVEGVEEESELVMRFPKPYGIFSPTENLISVKDASFAWSEDQPPLFEKVDFTIGSRARIAILGKNGCGTYVGIFVLLYFILFCECKVFSSSLLCTFFPLIFVVQLPITICRPFYFR